MSGSQKFNAILESWQQRVITVLSERLAKMLQVSNAVLMDFADKAENINVRNHFFEAQREIYLKRDSLLQNFHDFLIKKLKKFPAQTEDNLSPGYETLSLVNIELYERNLALRTLADKLEREHHQLLYMLSHRLTVINGGKPIDMSQIPASPHQISEIFSRCIAYLSIENDALLVLYTLFDKYVLSSLPELLGELNDKLVEAGILPHLKYSIRVQPNDEEPKDHQEKQIQEKIEQKIEETQQNIVEISEETLTRIQELLAAKRQAQRKKNLPPGISPATHQEVIEQVDSFVGHEVQTFPPAVRLDRQIKSGNISPEILQQIHKIIAAQRQQLKERIGVDRIPDREENIIDLVGILFDRMLDDPRIPDVAKALLGHLHSPYIKIGLRDEHFFSLKQHPARQFLDQAIEAAALWINEDELDKGVYPILKDIVFHIVQLKQYSNQDFENYRQLLAQVVERLENKFKLMEKHVQQAEQGKAMMSRAKTLARQATKDIFESYQIPDYCARFIEDVWIDYLTLLRLREGVDIETEAWHEALNLGRQIRDICVEIMQHEAIGAHIDQLSDQIWKSVGELLPHKAKEIEAFIHAMQSDPAKAVSVNLDQVEASEEEIEQQHMDEEILLIMDEIKRLPENTVFEFKLKNHQTYRAKMVWYNDYSKRCLFVNNRGKKVALIAIRELAEAIRNKKVFYFTDIKQSFFARTMKAVKDILERAIHAKREGRA